MTTASDEFWNLDAAISRLEQQSDDRPLSERTVDVERLRSALPECGIEVTPEDEKVFSLYVEGVLDSRHLADHFGPRLAAADKSKS